MVERYNYIDFLRFVGITLIVIAHVEAPFTITQIRTFDVPLMVFVSGLSYSGRPIRPSWSSFYWPRIKRILIPVWFFLTFYFVVFSILKLPLTWPKVINSYLLTNEGGIGYVWIMRVFLLIMLVTPLLCKLNESLKNWNFYLSLFIIFLVNCQLVYLLSTCKTSLILSVAIETVPYLLGYSVFFLLGLNLRYSTIKEETFVFFVNSILLVAFVWYNLRDTGAINISMFKYPPTSSFVLYGVWVCIILWALRRLIEPISNNSFVLFVGRNTIWIYLWHIFLVIVSSKLFESWIVRYVFVYLGAIVVYFVQYCIVKILLKRYEWQFIKYLIG